MWAKDGMPLNNCTLVGCANSNDHGPLKKAHCGLPDFKIK